MPQVPCAVCALMSSALCPTCLVLYMLLYLVPCALSASCPTCFFASCALYPTCSCASHASCPTCSHALCASCLIWSSVLHTLMPYMLPCLLSFVLHVPWYPIRPHVLCFMSPFSLCTLLSHTLHALCPNTTFCALEFPLFMLHFFCLFAEFEKV